MRRFLVLAFVAAGLTGCQTDTDAMTTSATPSELSEAASSAIAGDMVSRFAEQVGPGTATIVLKEDASPSGQALAAALKGWGYAVATDQKVDEKKAAIQLAYMIDDFEGQALARLSTNKVELTRAYSTTAAGASPASPLSVMQRN
ncbi:conjugal transfer protein TrbH [Rhizobium sp. Leaf386]|uniref:conjugal transfer protein TrbH n=1 Tax=Rhizobium sp. Leaf386 TaxID=1736359 RepID=UPI000713366D|nr:conjugal transfer protein TrbH [Rhizobium sp. Leaf386]KQS95619.1 conjugal transfer protein TrbH [Rhizobium sp. Leaf386]